MRFSTRIIMIVGLSTLMLTSLYWLVGWHYVEQIEARQSEALQTFIGQQADRVVAGELASEVLQLVPGAQLYRADTPRPEALRGYEEPGAYRLEQGELLLVRIQPDTSERYALYLPLLEKLVEQEGSEQMEALVVAGGVLLFSLGAMGLTLILIWKQTVPVRQLMQAVQRVSPSAPCLQPLERRDELGELSRQFAALLERTQTFIQREQNFTRFASHELRTPLMTLRSSLALLQEMAVNDASPLQRRALDRIEQALGRMEKLTDSLLWLSREQRSEHSHVDNSVLVQLLEQLETLTPTRAEGLVLDLEAELDWSIHPFVLSVILDNLIRNAQEHGAAPVHIHADMGRLQVSNLLRTEPVPSLASDKSAMEHFGYGLPIVEQLCDKAGAHFQYGVENGHFIAEVWF